MDAVPPEPRPEELVGLVDALVAAAHEMADDGLVAGTAGNLSARAGELIAVSATGARLEALGAEHVTLVDLGGRVVRGRLAPTSELALHLEVYRRYRPGAVVHAHPPVATALACVLDELPCIHPDMLDLGGTIRVASYEEFASQAFARATADALSERNAALMSNHGTLAIADTPARAVERTRLLEWSSALYWRAAMIGSPRVLTARQQQELSDTVSRIGYGRLHPLEP